ncbi:MAG TPA: hypothetical protein VL200_03530 [Lacunisphaera sp.]|jgi:hypothetical protein|nr:hypothetical protein [Lacunisphaera sp.]
MLFVSQLFIKSTDRDDSDHFWPLQSRISRRIYTSRFYGPMLKLLDRIGAIERFRDGWYQPAKVSIQYRLVAAYATGICRYPIAAPRLAARLERAMSLSSYARMAGKPRRWILDCYRHTSLPADIVARLAAHPFKSSDGRNAAWHHLQVIRDHRLRFYVCPRSGRVYYPVAFLPKAIRKALLLRDAPVDELDLAASQPTLLATLLPPDHPERKRYLAFVQGGRFYEEIAEWVGENWDRAEAKTAFFHQIAYGSYYARDEYRLLAVFRRKFPRLVRQMERIKRRRNDALPLQMQKLEASIAIDGAIGECAQHSIPVLPVHDSLICRQTDRELVAEIFARHWEKNTGIPALLKG